MLTENQNKLITDMTTNEIIAERRELRRYIDGCRFETATAVENYFEAVTLLIWKHHQVGLIYDCYYDGMANKRDGGADLEGSDQVVYDTLELQSKVPNIITIFQEIHCTGNAEEGYRFGQVVYDLGDTSGGVQPGSGSYEPFEALEMCECVVKFAEDKWRITEEWGVRSTFAVDRVLSGAPPQRG